MSSSFAHGLITLAVALSDRIIVATDGTNTPTDWALPQTGIRAIEIERGFVVAGSGMWQTSDRCIDCTRDIQAAFRVGDTAESFLHRFDRLYRNTLERFLTRRFRESPGAVLRECFSPLNPPLSLIVCELGTATRGITTFDYIPMLTGDDEIVLTPLAQPQEAGQTAVFGAIGAAAPQLHLTDRTYVDHAMRGPGGPEACLRALLEDTIRQVPTALLPATVQSFSIGAEGASTRSESGPLRRKRRTEHPVGSAFPPVDTADIVAVEDFVRRQFSKMYVSSRMEFLPRVFADVEKFFSGRDPDYAPIDLRYHDLEHTLQATVCATMILAGRHAARAIPRINAHHFEVAIAAALLHDSGYLKLRSDNRGTGAKYTYCHVLRSCAFAASYLPTIGMSGEDLEIVLSAVNCTGPQNEMSRLRFQAPVDEIIGCIVASADYLGQMAAADYTDELGILFEEFQESDDFLQIPRESRMFKSAQDLTARTPHFWHHYVLPKLDADFHGVYRFLAHPYPRGRNPYVEAIEANITAVRDGHSLPRATPPVAPARPTGAAPESPAPGASPPAAPLPATQPPAPAPESAHPFS